MSPWYHNIGFFSFSAKGNCCKSIVSFILVKSPESLLSLPFSCALSYKILAAVFPLSNSWLLKFERTLFSVAGSYVVNFFLVTANFSVNIILKHYFWIDNLITFIFEINNISDQFVTIFRSIYFHVNLVFVQYISFVCNHLNL